MTLVERFIEFSGWSTSRKTVLLMTIGLVAQLFLAPVIITAASFSGIADMKLLDVEIAGAMLVVLICLFAGRVCARAGREGRWTAYLVVVSYGGWIVTLDVALGGWSTPMLAWAPILVILVAIWYDEVIGWFAFAWSLFLYAVMVLLTLTGFLPYAPVLLNRSLDAQVTGFWAAATFAPFLGFYFYGFFLSILVVAARRVQDRRLRKAQQLIRRYVPSQIADSILSGAEATADKHERRKLTIFFSDLVGFTEIAEEMEPEDLSRVLNEYFSAMTAIAQKHGGTVDELSGDAILIFFGAPQATHDKDHALRAARMAIEMLTAVQILNAKWQSAGIDTAFKVRMGINTGVVTIGNFGSPDRMKYAALGKHVNLAARLQSNCLPGRVLLSHATWLLVHEEISCTQNGELQLKGIAKPVMTYEVSAAM